MPSASPPRCTATPGPVLARRGGSSADTSPAPPWSDWAGGRWECWSSLIFPHLENPDLPDNTMAAAERWAAEMSGPAYAIDDETAVKVVDDTVEVVSEGHWKLFERRSAPQPA